MIRGDDTAISKCQRHLMVAHLNFEKTLRCSRKAGSEIWPDQVGMTAVVLCLGQRRRNAMLGCGDAAPPWSWLGCQKSGIACPSRQWDGHTSRGLTHKIVSGKDFAVSRLF